MSNVCTGEFLTIERARGPTRLLKAHAGLATIRLFNSLKFSPESRSATVIYRLRDFHGRLPIARVAP
ncbi:hypothetical protein predicted by Glimmer/Critica (plasmid) [Sinorhizobium fredii HH103]|uniref:Uncharacterized protein n=1 Tax=Sinorhizobium fredii (strain HH103) TaxID=1117943 RepID=G9AIY4_SINF1|nr:hypothetical protein predicted by Glimmer/Critica [Sinorhizobium fredii HH103]